MKLNVLYYSISNFYQRKREIVLLFCNSVFHIHLPAQVGPIFKRTFAKQQFSTFHISVSMSHKLNGPQGCDTVLFTYCDCPLFVEVGKSKHNT